MGGGGAADQRQQLEEQQPEQELPSGRSLAAFLFHLQSQFLRFQKQLLIQSQQFSGFAGKPSASVQAFQFAEFPPQLFRIIEKVGDAEFFQIPVTVNPARRNDENVSGIDRIFSMFRKVQTRAAQNEHQFVEVMTVHNIRFSGMVIQQAQSERTASGQIPV